MDRFAVFGAQYLYLILLMLALAWYLLQPRSDQVEMIAWGMVALPLMAVLLLLMGMAYSDPRPFVSNGVSPLIPHSPDNGFPSDHTLICAATSSIVFFYNRRFSLLFWLMTAAVGASRVYTGIHHWLDIIASAVTAVSVTVLVWKFVLPRTKQVLAKVSKTGSFR